MIECWFDYLGLSAEARNTLFAHAYIDAYRAQYARRIDSTRASFVNPLHGVLEADSDDPKVAAKVARKRASLNRAREAADRLAVPYDFYCSSIVAYYARRAWTYLPKIFQIHSKDSVEHVRAHWERHIAVHVVLPVRGGDRLEFVDYIKRVVELRQHPKYLVRHLLDSGYIDISAATALFGTATVEQARYL